MFSLLVDLFKQEDFLASFSSLFIIIIIGYTARRMNWLTDHTQDVLSRLIVKIIVPALTLTVFMTDMSQKKLKLGFSFFIWSLFLYSLFLFIFRFFYPHKDSDERVILANMTAFSSNSLFGLPIIYAFFGQSGMILANIFNIPYRLLIFSYGLQSIGQKESSKGQKVGAGFFSNPVTLITLFSFLLWLAQDFMPQVIVNGQSYSIFRLDQTAYWLYRPLDILSSLISPVAWLLIGCQLAEMRLGQIYKKSTAYYHSFLKLIVAPLLTLVFSACLARGFLLDLSSQSIAIAIILMATPTTSMLVAFAMEADRQVEMVSLGTLLSTVLSLITLPLWLILLKWLAWL